MVDRFWLVWVTPDHTWQPRYSRTIDSVLRHHGHARVRVLSNTLQAATLRALSQIGDVAVQRYSLGAMLDGTRGSVWWSFRAVWNRSSYFANHEADLLRLLVLHTYGGVYLDTDVILTRPLPLPSSAGPPQGCSAAAALRLSAQGGLPCSCRGWLGIEASVPRAFGDEYIVCNAVLAFGARSSFLAAAIHAFFSEYTPFPPGLSFEQLLAAGVWGAMGPLLLTRITRQLGEEHVCVLEQQALYPIAPQEAASALLPWSEERDRRRWQRIQEESFAVHYWNALTKHVPVACGSLLHRLLEANCVVCESLQCV